MNSRPLALPIESINGDASALVKPAIDVQAANDGLRPGVGMTKPYQRQRQNKGAGLSERDWAVLHDLARVRLLTGNQIQRLHFTDGSPLTQARRTRSVLQRLNDAGLVSRLNRRIGGIKAGSAGYVYGLATKGQRLTSKKGPAGGTRRRRPWTPSASFTDHILGVSELYVRLRELQVIGEVELVNLETEPRCWRHWVTWTGERRVCKPDAFSVVVVEDLEHHTFIELDRSTQSRSVIRRKAEDYIAYWRSGTEQAKNDVFPKVLFVVCDQERRTQIVDVLAALDAETWRLFQVCAAEEAPAVLAGRPPP